MILLLLLLASVFAQSCKSHAECESKVCNFQDSQIGVCVSSATTPTNSTSTCPSCPFGQVCRDFECQPLIPINTTTISLLVLAVVVLLIGALLCCCWCNCCCFSGRKKKPKKPRPVQPPQPPAPVFVNPQPVIQQPPPIQEYHIEEIVEVVPFQEQPNYSSSIPMQSVQPPNRFPNNSEYYSAQPLSYEPSTPALLMEQPNYSSSYNNPIYDSPRISMYDIPVEKQESPRMAFNMDNRTSKQSDARSYSDIMRQQSMNSRIDSRNEARRIDSRNESMQDSRRESFGAKRTSNQTKYRPIMNQKVGPVVQDDPEPPQIPGFFGFWDKRGKFHQGFRDETKRVHGGVFDDQSYFHFGVFGTVEPVYVEDHMMATYYNQEKKYQEVQDARETGDSMDVYANETHRGSLDK